LSGIVLFFVAAALRGAFIAPDAFDALQIIPPPPAPDSIAAEGERLALTLIATHRTPEQTALAQRWERYDAFKLLQPVVGDWATPQTLPKLAEFIRASLPETRPFTDRAKNTYARHRPHQDMPQLTLAIAKPDGFSYPSGHATAAALHAALLAAVLPEHAADFAHQAELAGASRLFGGAHYPSDVAAGRRLGEAIAREMLKTPATQQALDEIRRELTAAIAAHRAAA
jgi:acid phosphatase (class A)